MEETRLSLLLCGRSFLLNSTLQNATVTIMAEYMKHLFSPGRQDKLVGEGKQAHGNIGPMFPDFRCHGPACSNNESSSHQANVCWPCMNDEILQSTRPLFWGLHQEKKDGAEVSMMAIRYAWQHSMIHPSVCYNVKVTENKKKTLESMCVSLQNETQKYGTNITIPVMLSGRHGALAFLRLCDVQVRMKIKRYVYTGVLALIHTLNH